MKRNLIFTTIIVFSMLNVTCAQEKKQQKSQSSTSTSGTKPNSVTNIYSFNNVTDINGKSFDFSTLKGKKILIVNTASECGYTPQYAELEKLYQQYKDSNFEIIGVPSNDFGAQEPGSNEEIKTFCQKNYGVTFPLLSKVSVLAGPEQSELYKYLTTKSLNGNSDSKVSWNFQKYLIDENGFLVDVLPSKVTPMSDEITTWIKSKK